MNRRQIEILGEIAGKGEVLVTVLAKRYGVAAMTIRRDLDDLAGQGKAVRTHGGAMASPQSIVEFSFAGKSRLNIARKRAIGRHIAGLLRDGATVVMDTGTTTLEVARSLAAAPKRLTVLTTSLAIASVLHPLETVEVILLGGTMRKASPDLSGTLTEENLKRFRVEIAVLGADAVSREGIFTADVGIARCSRAMIDSARKRVLAIDSSKFAARALYRFAAWKDIHHVVTDRDIPAGSGKWLRSAVRKVSVVDAGEKGYDRK